jgi:hypothetical protein
MKFKTRTILENSFDEDDPVVQAERDRLMPQACGRCGGEVPRDGARPDHLDGCRGVTRLTRKQREAAHRYGSDGRCICGGLAVYFEDDEHPGHGCEIEGRPWARAVARLDPQVRRDEARAASLQ